MAIFLCRQ